MISRKEHLISSLVMNIRVIQIQEKNKNIGNHQIAEGTLDYLELKSYRKYCVSK